MSKIVLPFLISISIVASSQSVLDLKLDGAENGKPLALVLAMIGQKTGADFFYLPAWIDQISFGRSYEGQTLAEALDNLFTGTNLNYILMYPQTVVIVRDFKQALLRKEALKAARLEQRKIEQHVFGEIVKSKKGQVNISGKVINSKTHEPISGANVRIRATEQGTTTSAAGTYTLLLAPGMNVLNFSFFNFEDKVIDLTAYSDGEINVELDDAPVLLDEVIVHDNSANELATGRIGQTQLTMSEIKRLPALMGEVDLVKQVQSMAGVTTVGEAASGFNVRGGSVDQNLILYDGLPVFNSAHAFGFLSAFNSEALRDVSFYRGGIPAEYGGRASSVLDIQSKDGDYKKWNGNAGIGIITSNLMFSGPLQKEKTSLAASFRSTYSNWLVHSIRTDYVDLRKSSVFFYDGTLKLTHLFSTRTKLSVTGYSSRDSFRLKGDSTYQWHNLQGSAKLNHQFSPALSSEFVAGVSNYGYSVLNADPLTASALSYQITSTVVKAGFNYQRGIHKINFGWQLTHYRFGPGTLKPTSPLSNAKPLSLDNQNSIESALYLADEVPLNSRTFLEAGLRLPMFVSFGKASVNVYKDDAPLEINNITDTLNFKSGQLIKTYFGLEPRLSFRWMASPTTSIKLGYNRMYQYLHLVTNTTAITPVDIWQPSGYYFKPQRADQISVGIFSDFTTKKYGVSLEGFYKDLNNILDFKDGAQLILNRHLETDLLQGKGKSFGIEASFSKHTGRISGTLNYTYSRSFRLISGPTAGESVNSGKQYPASFDQPHILNVTWKYSFSRRYFFTGNFTFHSGRPVTIPLSAFQFENTTVAYFSSRNQYRIPDYHRLDVALVLEGNHKRKKIASGTWVLSVYNAYARKNPYTVFFKSSAGEIPKPYQLSIIGTIFPSISYNVKF